MSQIPAPLWNRHTAIAVALVALLGAAAAVATLVIPIDGSVLWLVLVRQAVLAVQAVVLALAIFLIWRTLAVHSFAVTLAALAAIGGFLILAAVQVVGIAIANAWPTYVVTYSVEAARGLAGALLFVGLMGLGISVMARGAWRGPTQLTVFVAGLLVAVLACAWPLGLLAIAYAVWSLSFLGLVVGLRTRRTVPVSGTPDAQLGAARV